MGFDPFWPQYLDLTEKEGRFLTVPRPGRFIAGLESVV